MCSTEDMLARNMHSPLSDVKRYKTNTNSLRGTQAGKQEPAEGDITSQAETKAPKMQTHVGFQDHIQAAQVAGAPSCAKWAQERPCGGLGQCSNSHKVSTTSLVPAPSVLHCSMSPQWLFLAHILRGGRGPGHPRHKQAVNTRN